DSASETVAHPTPILPCRGHLVRKPTAIGTLAGWSFFSSSASRAIFCSRALVSATDREVRTSSSSVMYRDEILPRRVAETRKDDRQRHLGREHAPRVVTAERYHDDRVVRAELLVHVLAEGLTARESRRTLRHRGARAVKAT